MPDLALLLRTLVHQLQIQIQTQMKIRSVHAADEVAISIRHSDRAVDRTFAERKFAVLTATLLDTNVHSARFCITHNLLVRRRMLDFSVLALFRAADIAVLIAVLFVADFTLLAEVRSTSVINAT